VAAREAVIAHQQDLDATLALNVRAQRIVCVSGLPGVGKSLFVRELARAAHAAGRTVHLLQWDVVRLAFATPEIEARYPERDGITHAVIRRAVGEWARGAVLRWHRAHPSSHILIGEVPLIGHRLLELVQVHADDVERVLAGEDTLFIMPVPSAVVRGVIADARGGTNATPAHARESADASPSIVQSSWQEIHSLAASIGAATPSRDRQVPYDSQTYAAVYRHLLRHRHTLTLWVDVQLEPRSSVYDLDVAARELAPTADETAAVFARLAREYTTQQIEDAAARWFDTV
jgi:hypothetical protein